MTYVVATNNKGKMEEIRAFLLPLQESLIQESKGSIEGTLPNKFAKVGLDIKCLSDFNLSLTPAETGSTFEENAKIKAREVSALLYKHGYNNVAVIADDSGLCINAFDDKPGVDSAYFLGENTPYYKRNATIIKMLKNATDRAAHFKCVMVCRLPNGSEFISTGEMHGEIATEVSGTNGFGYDPIFYLKEYNKTVAELSKEEKNAISHRGIALYRLMEQIFDIAV